jgi:hypothetical protein
MSLLTGFRAFRDFFSATFRSGILWFRMPGFVSWVAVSCGIALSLVTPLPAYLPYSATISPGVILATAVTLLIAGVLTRKNTLRFIAFFFTALLICSVDESHQHKVFRSFDRLTVDGQMLSLTGKVISPPLPWFENFHFLLHLDSVAGDPDNTLKGITLNCTLPYEPPQYGIVRIRSFFAAPHPEKSL